MQIEAMRVLFSLATLVVIGWVATVVILAAVSVACFVIGVISWGQRRRTIMCLAIAGASCAGCYAAWMMVAQALATVMGW